ncbi:MAG: aminopeptidase P N-terminal domain-containing protein [Thermoanaerobaculia bacterium]
MPTVGNDLFARRRERFFDRVKEGVALLFATPEQNLSWDGTYRYRPDPDLFYLTGFAEPEAVAVLDAGARAFFLFVRPKDRERETWEGRRAGVKGAVKLHGADAAWEVGELEKKLPELIRGSSSLHYAFGVDEKRDLLVASILGRFRREARNPQRGPVAVNDVTDVIHEMRLRKEPEEIVLMERAAAIAAAAHDEARALARPGRFEYEVEAAIGARFRREGAAGPSYETIVASGPNATTLHYVENDRRIEDGDLVLVDAGCEVEGYASDITRTFPASGRFAPEQEAIYRIVLSALHAATSKVRPGGRFQDVHDAAVEVLVDGLLELGLLSGKRKKVIEKGDYTRFYMHRTSHWLGMDVHDRGRYHDAKGEWRLLEPGMVLTVEPGLYVRPDEKKVPSPFLGIGVRIEDDVLVTEQGHRVLTAAAPKSVEAMCAHAEKRPARKAKAAPTSPSS